MVSRTRVRSTSVVVTRQEGPWKPIGSTWVGTPSTLSFSRSHPDVMTDVVTPGFKTRSLKGEVINSPMTKMESSTSFVPADLRLWTPGPPDPTGWRNTGWGSGLVIPEDGLISEGMSRSHGLITQAVTEAFGKVNLPDVDALVTLAEMRETLSFLAGPFKKATDLTRRYRDYLERYKSSSESFQRRLALWEKRNSSKRGASYPKPVFNPPKFKVGKFEASDVSSAWLAYRYGLMPLIYDIQGYLKAYNNVAEKPQRMTARGKAVDDWDTHTDNSYNWNYGLREDVTTDTKFKLSVRAGVLYTPKVTAGTMGGTIDKYGLALHRVPSAVWESVTLSFVADWFLNVGDYLNAITATCRAEILTAWATVQLDVGYFSTVKVGKANAYQQIGGDPIFIRTVKQRVRQPVTMSAIGVVRRVEMNAKRYADAAALIHTMLLSALKKR